MPELDVTLTLPDGAAVRVDRAALPRSVAVIMDGNGRWAEKRGWLRVIGHENGVDSVRDITTASAELHLERLTLYAFSTENWSRPKSEIDVLFRLLSKFLIDERPTLMNNNVRLTSIGEIERLPEKARADLRATEALTAKNTGLALCLALSYGGRDEITRAARRIAEAVKRGELEPAAITEDTVANHLYAPGTRDPDLLIRTAGEMRVSNFLLWQISYAEFYVTELLWPEFRKPQFHEALLAYTRRKRRFGAIEKK